MSTKAQGLRIAGCAVLAIRTSQGCMHKNIKIGHAAFCLRTHVTSVFSLFHSVGSGLLRHSAGNCPNTNSQNNARSGAGFHGAFGVLR